MMRAPCGCEMILRNSPDDYITMHTLRCRQQATLPTPNPPSPGDEADSRSTDIPPALTPDEWINPSTKIGEVGWSAVARVDGSRIGRRDSLALSDFAETELWVSDVSDLAALIALANAAYPDEDPRKFTHEHVDALREARDLLNSEAEGYADRPRFVDLLDDLFGTIESYLPPDPRMSERTIPTSPKPMMPNSADTPMFWRKRSNSR